jgi:hypothetical protein
MKTKLLKISVLTTALFLLFAGACWAYREKDRQRRPVGNKHIHSKQDRNTGYYERSHHNRRSYEHPRRQNKRQYRPHHAPFRAKRHAFNHGYRHHHRHKVYHRHYHRHQKSHNAFSYRMSIFEPGWSITVKTKNRW